MERFPGRALLALAVLAALGGCSTLAPRPRDADITELLAERGGPALDASAGDTPAAEAAAIQG